MKNLRSSFDVTEFMNPSTFILLNDKCIDHKTMSITNDAENVVEFCIQNYGPKRIMYYDANSIITELVHDNKKFTGFKEHDEFPNIYL